MFSQLCLCSAKRITFLLSSLPNMIIDSVSRWVGSEGSVGKWSMTGWLVGQWSVDLIKPRTKHVWGSDFA